jgi:hypothetical protein
VPESEDEVADQAVPDQHVAIQDEMDAPRNPPDIWGAHPERIAEMSWGELKAMEAASRRDWQTLEATRLMRDMYWTRQVMTLEDRALKQLEDVIRMLKVDS